MSVIIRPGGDLFASQAQALVNPVNCVGVMGAGLALAFKRRWPEMFAAYQVMCAGRVLRLGEPQLWRPADDGAGPAVVLFPTKGHWREDSQWEPIAVGLGRLAERLPEWGVTSLAVPALGCGLGGLSWETTETLLLARLEELPAAVELYPPR